MRGEDRTSGALFSYVDVEARIPAKHPLRAMRRLTNEVAPRGGTVLVAAKLEVRLLVVLYQAAKGSVCCCF